MAATHKVESTLTARYTEQSNLDAIEAQHQRHWMLWRFLKTVVHIELLGAFMDRMNQQGAHTGVLRYGDGAHDRVMQHGSPQLDALRPPIDRQSAKHHDGNWIGHIAPNRAGRDVMSDRTSGHGVEAAHPIFLINDHKSPAGPGELVVHRPAL